MLNVCRFVFHLWLQFDSNDIETHKKLIHCNIKLTAFVVARNKEFF